MEWKGLGSAAVTATPIMSNTMPRPMNTASTSAATTYPVPSRAVVEKKLSSADSTTASTNTRRAQPRPLFFFPPFLSLLLSRSLKSRSLALLL